MLLSAFNRITQLDHPWCSHEIRFGDYNFALIRFGKVVVINLIVLNDRITKIFAARIHVKSSVAGNHIKIARSIYRDPRYRPPYCTFDAVGSGIPN